MGGGKCSQEALSHLSVLRILDSETKAVQEAILHYVYFAYDDQCTTILPSPIPNIARWSQACHLLIHACMRLLSMAVLCSVCAGGILRWPREFCGPCKLLLCRI